MLLLNVPQVQGHNSPTGISSSSSSSKFPEAFSKVLDEPSKVLSKVEVVAAEGDDDDTAPVDAPLLWWESVPVVRAALDLVRAACIRIAPATSCSRDGQTSTDGLQTDGLLDAEVHDVQKDMMRISECVELKLVGRRVLTHDD